MKIRELEIDVDVEKELSYYSWEKETWTPNKLIACSPFRSDTTPSFFVRLIEQDGYPEGIWNDSAGSGNRKSGTFIQLLSFLKNMSEEEIEDYLIETYSSQEIGYKKNLEITIPKLALNQKKSRINGKILDGLTFNPSYLSSRGISENVQKNANILYDEKKKAIAIPWYNANGELLNVKYRSTCDKQFWYAKGGYPISKSIYNLNAIYENKNKAAVLCESEIDTLTVLSAGIPSIALGGANFSSEKEDLLIKSPIERLVIATDMDKVGREIAETIAEKLSIYMDVYIASFDSAKDINEAGTEKVKEIIKNSKKYKKTLKFFV